MKVGFLDGLLSKYIDDSKDECRARDITANLLKKIKAYYF